ncbi:MAG: hypothetical protein EP330_17585 [Deltaproteobacteria bacterium]|nr:MAG: hypothetical protein EP330_17585 [Deltaproteobacteria bacterium]
MRFAALLLLAGCGPGLLQNSAPRLRSVNGVEVTRLGGVPTGDARLKYEPGEVFVIELDIRDQEGNDVSVWWPDSPRGWRFPSDDTVGEWEVPPEEEILDWNFLVVLEDQHPRNPLTASWRIPLWRDEPLDTGGPGDTGP